MIGNAVYHSSFIGIALLRVSTGHMKTNLYGIGEICNVRGVQRIPFGNAYILVFCMCRHLIL